MQRWIGQQIKLVKRQAGMSEKGSKDSATAAKAAYLEKLGLGAKAKEVASGAGKKRPWHLDHMVAGDIFKGTFTHPNFARGSAADLVLKVASPTGGTWSSVRGDFEGEFKIEQDFPIIFEPGEARDEAIVTYIFQKFNPMWRRFSEPMPSAEEMETIKLPSLQLFFEYVAEVKGFPSEEEYKQNTADPEKGMTKAEFLKYTKGEDPEYLESSFPNVFTGRRIRIGDGDLQLDGDFQAEIDGLVNGFTYVQGEGGGQFTLKLAQRAGK